MKRVILITCIIFTLFLCACEKSDGYTKASFVAMDTVIDIKLKDKELDEDSLSADCEKIVLEIEAIVSKTLPESDTSFANSEIDIMLDVSPVFAELVTLSLDLSERTNGSFDISTGTLKELWEKCASENREPSEEEIKSTLSKTGKSSIFLNESTLEKNFKETKLDFGAVGKGYAADKVCKMLTEKGVDSGIISFGGNIALVGEKENGEPYKVGVKDPFDTSKIIGTLSLEGGFVSVSGDYERSIDIGSKKYCHIIDPGTGYPVSNGTHSVTVISNDGVLADALSTALFVDGRDTAAVYYENGSFDFEAIFVTDEGIFATAGLKDIFTPEKGKEVKYLG